MTQPRPFGGHVRTGTEPAMVVASRSDTGRVRLANEDRVLVVQPELAEAREIKGCLYLVADGMGGRVCGVRASGIVARTVPAAYYEPEPADVPLALVRAFRAANRQLHDEIRTRREFRRMGSTCTAIVVRGRQAWVAHVGDSRAYLFRDGELQRLTRDHRDLPPPSATGTGRLRAVAADPAAVVRVLGREADVGVDVTADPIALLDGDRLVLCSDGLTGALSDAVIRDFLLQTPVHALADALVEEATQRSGDDNISVVVVGVGDVGPAVAIAGEEAALGPSGEEPEPPPSEPARPLRPVAGLVAEAPAAPDPTAAHGRGRRRDWRSLGLAGLLGAAAATLLIPLFREEVPLPYPVVMDASVAGALADAPDAATEPDGDEPSSPPAAPPPAAAAPRPAPPPPPPPIDAAEMQKVVQRYDRHLRRWNQYCPAMRDAIAAAAQRRLGRPAQPVRDVADFVQLIHAYQHRIGVRPLPGWAGWAGKRTVRELMGTTPAALGARYCRR